MPVLHERIDHFGVELVACKDGCAGILRRQSEGILPRSLFLERAHAAGRGCLAVGLNPGTSKAVERDFYRKHGSTYDVVKEYRTRIDGIPYFSRVRSIIEQMELTGPILWSNLVKCENESGRKGLLPPLQTLRHCTRRFLARELAESPRDWVVLGIGWEAYRALAYLVPERTVIGIPHPTGGYRDFRKMLEKEHLRKDIKDRALGALRSREPSAVWLGSEKSGA